MNSRGFLSRFTEPVKPQYGDYALEICSLCTGLIDAVSFNNWGTFVGMQTGNTVILGLSAADLPTTQPHAAVTTLASLGSFIIGAHLTFVLARLTTPTLRRSTIIISFLIQGALIIISAALAVTYTVPQDLNGEGSVLDNILIVAAIPPLAFQSGMQIATSRILGFNELPTCVLTSSYADIAGDKELWRLRNVKRNRRVASAVCLLIGAICSGWIMRRGAGADVALWVAAGLKVACAVLLGVFMKGVEQEREDEV
ncbi:DUF1275 domain protein [Aulographum hederae CBS 113979]|uniref:DUF1275 domain protein n=1 Tax=Aulographum hederae CBS 113979 TaxID=1176131 RepID=A0A6G1GKV5_9PEZI|nr:DUF1275 domain protein [Aulographum hederae CBS 113979]